MAPRTKKVARFKTEADLCASFRARAQAAGWDVYAEVGGWDLLLVWGGEAPVPTPACVDYPPGSGPMQRLREKYETGLAAGTQIGVQAKLRPSLDVLAQGIERATPTWKGPDFRAVLVPEVGESFRTLANALGLHVYVEATDAGVVHTPIFRWITAGQIWIPPVIPTWEGGGPGPRTLSEWRVGALRICGLLRSRGWVTKADFARVGVEHRTWVSRGWIKGARVGHEHRYQAQALAVLPDLGYEAERDALTRLDSAG